MQSLVLLDGIKGWATAGEEYVQWMDEYEWLSGAKANPRSQRELWEVLGSVRSL